MLEVHENPDYRGCLEDEDTPEHVLSDCPPFLAFVTLTSELRELHLNSIVIFNESTGLL